jgi:hypothetical protein
MDRHHYDTSFLQFKGRRISKHGSALPPLPTIRTAHDQSRDERDAVLKALIITQRRLAAAIEIIHYQDRAIAVLDSPLPKVDSENGEEWNGYRLFWKHNCNYYYDLGFHSRGASENAGFDSTRKSETFIKHVKGCYAPDSEYISVSDIPGRIWNLPDANRPDFEVALIDLKKLQRLGQPVFRTTHLQQQLKVYEHIDYVTESHIVV